jgi:hypothetical protein
MISLTEGERVLDVGRHLVSCCQQREHIDPSGSVPFAKITPSATLCSQPKSGSALFLQVLRNHGQIWGRDLRCYAQFSCQMRGGHACRALTMAPAKAQQGLMKRLVLEGLNAYFKPGAMLLSLKVATVALDQPPSHILAPNGWSMYLLLQMHCMWIMPSDLGLSSVQSDPGKYHGLA